MRDWWAGVNDCLPMVKVTVMLIDCEDGQSPLPQLLLLIAVNVPHALSHDDGAGNVDVDIDCH